jgi:hypothetical protein
MDRRGFLLFKKEKRKRKRTWYHVRKRTTLGKEKGNKANSQQCQMSRKWCSAEHHDFINIKSMKLVKHKINSKHSTKPRKYYYYYYYFSLQAILILLLQ